MHDFAQVVVQKSTEADSCEEAIRRLLGKEASTGEFNYLTKNNQQWTPKYLVMLVSSKKQI